MDQIRAVRPEDFIEPQMAEGTFEPIEKMNHFEKCAFTVMMRLDQRIKELREAIKGGHLKSNEVGPAEAEIRVLASKRDRVEERMFFSIHDRLDNWDKPLDVSKGWKVIIPEERGQIHVIEVQLKSPAALASIIEAVAGAAMSAQEVPGAACAKGCQIHREGNETMH